MKQQSINNNDFLNNLSQLPSHVSDWIFSVEIGENCIKIAKKFNLKQEKIPSLAKITSYVIEKTVPLEKLPEALEKSLSINKETARQIAIEVAIKQFLPIRDYLAGTENYIKSLGGQLPSTLPPIIKAKPEEKEEEKPKVAISEPAKNIIAVPEPEKIIEKDITSAITERENIVDQIISEKPIKFTDSEMLKIPSIKNWLTDYKKFKANLPDLDLPLVRGRYLYESPNTKNLNESERIVLNHLLKSLDEYTRLPFSQKTGRLIVEKLIQPPVAPQPSLPRPTPPPAPPPPRPTPPPTAPPIPLSQKDVYREPVAPEDVAGPQVAQRPEPKLDGNIIDLKNL